MAALRATIAAADKPVVPGVTAPASMDGVEKSRITIPVRDGASIAAALYRPVTKPDAGSPLVVAFHGGGWCLGVPEMEEVNWWVLLLLLFDFGCIRCGAGLEKRSVC